MTQQLPTVVVMGVAGCGKTTLGEALSQRLGMPFRDGDEFHSQQAIDKMQSGSALDDEDRRPWLERISAWLGEQPDGAVVACSALKRSYRDLLRAQAPGLAFVHLAGPREVAAERVASRTDHFMPASLVDSQYETLQPLEADEHGTTLDFTDDVESLLEQALRALR